MLLTLLSLLSADADACSPGMAVYLDSTPDSGGTTKVIQDMLNHLRHTQTIT